MTRIALPHGRASDTLRKLQPVKLRAAAMNVANDKCFHERPLSQAARKPFASAEAAASDSIR